MSISSVPQGWALCIALVLGVSLGAGCASAPAPAPEDPKPVTRSYEYAPGWRHVPASPSSGCAHPSSTAGALLARTGHLETPYLLTLPDGYDGTQPVPLVFVQVSYSGLKLKPDRGHVIDFRLWTSPPSDVRIRLGLDAAPFSEYWVKTMATTREPQRVTDDVVFLPEPAPGTLALGFQFAGPYAREVPVTLCIDEVDITAE